MKCVVYNYFTPKETAKNYLDDFLKLECGDKAYYEARLKYCNFYLINSGDKSDKTKIKNIYDNLIKMDYYKACSDYGLFLVNEKNMMKLKLY